MRTFILPLMLAISAIPLSAGAAMQPDPAPATPTGATVAEPNPDDRVRCRRIPVTGSLVRTVRVCKTVGEWRELSARGNDVARAQLEGGSVCTGGLCRGFEEEEGIVPQNGPQ